jgi:hypothetical protein
VPPQANKRMTTMISNQVNQVEALSDAKLDDVAGGFSLGSLVLSLTAMKNGLHHPVDNAGFLVSETRNVAKNILSIF